jgi:DNA-binding NarL/FixJ family response regulator
LLPLRIVVVDDFPSWRQFVATMLQEHPQYRIVGEAADGAEAVRRCAELQPDLVLLDIGLPRIHGIEAAKRICAVAPRSKILFVSENQCRDIVETALQASSCTRGYILKSDAGADLWAGLQAMLEDKQFVSPRLLSRSKLVSGSMAPLWFPGLSGN